MAESELKGALTVLRSGSARMGADRVALLQAIDGHGSIASAAREVGLSYKAAWDAVRVMNNLFALPLVEAAPGGRAGGGAVVTAAGEQVIQTFAAIEAGLRALLEALEARLDLDPSNVLWSMLMKTSARNTYRCTVTRVIDGQVNAEVVMSLTDGQTLSATITEHSAVELGLAPGVEVFALIKSSFVILATGPDLGGISVRNRLTGTVASRTDGPVNSEIVVDLGGGKSIAAIITRESADALGLKLGDPATALVKASHVIIAMP